MLPLIAKRHTRKDDRRCVSEDEQQLKALLVKLNRMFDRLEKKLITERAKQVVAEVRRKINDSSK